MQTGQLDTCSRGLSASEDSSDYSDTSSDDSEREGHQKKAISTTKLKKHLVCTLCCGYFIDAQTSVECLHTFCRRCLLQAGAKKRCPLCKINLKQKQPFKSDRTIQSIVDKIFPHFEEQEIAEINKFYHSRNIKRKAERDHSREVTTQNSHGHVLRKKSYTRSRGEGSCWGEEVCFQLVPWKGGLGPLKKSYLRTSGQLRTIHIVKYIVKKLNLGCNSELEILCNGEVVGKEHNLTFLKRSRWHQNEHLTLHYRSTKKIL